MFALSVWTGFAVKIVSLSFKFSSIESNIEWGIIVPKIKLSRDVD